MKLFDRNPKQEIPVTKLQKTPFPASTERKMNIDAMIDQANSKAIPAEKKKPLIGEQASATSQTAPTEAENRWAEQKLAEELLEIEEEIQDADKLLIDKTMMDSMQIMADHGVLEPEIDAAVKPRKKRKSLGRINQIKTRLTDAELVQFQRRLKTSGLSQGDYLRSVALTGKIVIEDCNVADVAILDELAMIRAELGRQGGLLKMIIKPNEGQRQLAPEEWAELIETIKNMEQIKKRLSDLEARLQHGNLEA